MYFQSQAPDGEVQKGEGEIEEDLMKEKPSKVVLEDITVSYFLPSFFITCTGRLDVCPQITLL
jgi:hypothetical protein